MDFKCFPPDHLIQSEEELLATIHSKYKKKYHFTYIGMTTIAINPFMAYPQLYGPKMICTYQQNNILQLPPHIFGTFEYAYFHMKNFGSSSIILYGESGSGKTAVRKQAIRYLTSERNGGELRRVADQIVNSNLLLDAFGNAKIESNESSTRYVIFFDLEFDFKTEIAGATINECALEKTRIVNRKNNERNFHIFHQLIAGADVRLLKNLKLQRKSSNFHLLNCGKNALYDTNNNDSKQFAITRDCLATLGFNEDEIFFIWKMIASILKIGNIEFIPKIQSVHGNDGCTLSNEYELYETCELLLIDVYDFQNALTRRIIETKKDQIVTDLTASEAAFVRDVLCKTLYSQLFTWIVKKINDVIRPKKVQKRRCIGIMDSFGFEHYKHNNYDLFMKNYLNERLLKHFVDINLKHEQELYLLQEINWPRIDISGFDVCTEIENNIFTALNEDCLCLNSTEQQLLHQFTSNSNYINCATCEQLDNPAKCSKTESLNIEKTERHCTFVVKHYFTKIHYDISDFQLKNCESKLSRELATIFHRSSIPALRDEMFPESSTLKLPIHKRQISQCSQISHTFENLLNLATRDRKEHYVHCFLPNADYLLQEKQLKRIDSAESSGSEKNSVTTINFDLIYFANQFHSRQLFNYWKIARNGYCMKLHFQEFFKRYNLISKSDSMIYQKNLLEMYCVKCQHLKPNHLCSEYMHTDETGLINAICKLLFLMDIRPNEIDFGLEYLFIRQYCTLFKIEQIRTNRITYLVICIQRTWRCSLLRRKFLCYRQSQYIIARSYLNYRRKKFLSELASFIVENLPSSLSPICNIWPPAPLFLCDLNDYLYHLFHQSRCKMYRNSFDPIGCGLMREKVTASSLFRHRKLSYEKSVHHPFYADYLKLKSNVKWLKLSQENESFNDHYIVFADLVNKVSTSGKYFQCVLALSTRSILVLDHRTLHIKQRIPIENVNLSVSPYIDDFVVIQLIQWPYSNKTKFKNPQIFEIEHLIEFCTKLFLVIQNLTSKCLEIHVNDEVPIKLSKEISLIKFIYSPKGKQVNPAKIIKKFNKLEILLST